MYGLLLTTSATNTRVFPFFVRLIFVLGLCLWGGACKGVLLKERGYLHKDGRKDWARRSEGVAAKKEIDLGIGPILGIAAFFLSQRFEWPPVGCIACRLA